MVGFGWLGLRRYLVGEDQEEEAVWVLFSRCWPGSGGCMVRRWFSNKKEGRNEMVVQLELREREGGRLGGQPGKGCFIDVNGGMVASAGRWRGVSMEGAEPKEEGKVTGFCFWLTRKNGRGAGGTAPAFPRSCKGGNVFWVFADGEKRERKSVAAS
ncbi:hypothetical protein HAX54_009356 [Datura stramonium]|uniref:Uncharacterized protein n=1 Tax=Datura stramonium TaxID=4076 RepID=A0ABS8TGG2_DATST|nr:hypothetical protein [Datura stramonium]